MVYKPVRWSELKAQGLEREEIVKCLLERCNELGKMQAEVLEEAAVSQ